MMITDFAARLATVFTGNGKLVILTYHRVLRETDPVFDDITSDMFKAHLSALKHTFNVVRLDEAVRMLNSKCLPPRAVAITFDDGYADNFEIALPILNDFQMPATFFIASGFIDHGIMWNDIVRCACKNAMENEIRDYVSNHGMQSSDNVSRLRKQIMQKNLSALKYLPLGERTEKARAFAEVMGQAESESLMMTWDQVAQLPAYGVEVGAHTVNHPILTSISVAEAEQEIRECRAALQDATSQKISSFAYPNGNPATDYDANHLRILRELGFDTAVTTRFACAKYGDSPLELPRLGLWDGHKTKAGFRLVDYFLRH